jgi:hypothetical protein
MYIQLCSNVVVEVTLCTDFVFMDTEYAQDPDTELGADRGSYGATTRSETAAQVLLEEARSAH